MTVVDAINTAITQIVDPPGWLIELAHKPRTRPQKTSSPSSSEGTPYGLAALAAETAYVAQAPEGVRNDTLNRAAFSIGQLIAGGELDPDDAAQALRQAAAAAGLGPTETDRTITSGIRAGSEHPRCGGQPYGPDTIPTPTLITPARVDQDELAPTQHLNLIPTPALLEDTEPEPDELVEGLIRQGELVVIGAPRAVGKSWFALQLALQLAAGTGHLCGTLPVLQSARVLFCHGEVDRHEAKRRIRLLTESPTWTDTNTTNLANTFDPWRITLTTKQIRRPQPDQSAITTSHVEALLDGRIETAIEANDIQVLILDPWATYYSGSENSNDETEAALSELRRLQLDYGLTIIIIHHFGKSTEGRDPEDLWRGASRLADWASTRISITPHYTHVQAKELGLSRDNHRRYLDVTFLRRSLPLDDLTCMRDLDGWFVPWNPDDQPPEGLSVPQRILDHAWTALEVAALLEADGGEWASLRAAAAAMGISKDSAARVLQRAVNEGTIATFPGPRRAIGYRLAENQLSTDSRSDTAPDSPDSRSDTAPDSRSDSENALSGTVRDSAANTTVRDTKPQVSPQKTPLSGTTDTIPTDTPSDLGFCLSDDAPSPTGRVVPLRRPTHPEEVGEGAADIGSHRPDGQSDSRTDSRTTPDAEWEDV